MTRKKVDLVYITDRNKRKITYKKRKTGLVKKTKELSILCGIEACAVIYMPDYPEPEVWPSKKRVRRVFSKFKAKTELQQQPQMTNQEILLKKRIIQAQEKLKKVKNENKKAEMKLRMFQYVSQAKNIFDNANGIHLNDISHLTDKTMKKTERNEIETLDDVCLEWLA